MVASGDDASGLEEAKMEIAALKQGLASTAAIGRKLLEAWSDIGALVTALNSDVGSSRDYLSVRATLTRPSKSLRSVP